MHQHSGSAQRKSGIQVSWSGLIIGKCPMRRGTARKKALRQRDLLESPKPLLIPELNGTRQDYVFRQAMIRGIPHQHSCEVRLGGEAARRYGKVHRVVDALMGIDGIVAAVLNKCESQEADAYGLREQGDQPGRDLQSVLIDIDTPEDVAVLNSVGFRDALDKL